MRKVTKRIFSAAKILAVSTIAVLVLSPSWAGAIKVDSIEPATGPMAGGSKTLIKGSGFTKQVAEKFLDVAGGVEHAVMLSNNGHVWTLGRNNYGQLGIGSADQYKTTPQDITKWFGLDSNDQIKQVFSGDYFSFAISKKHRVFAWGANDQGQLGIGSTQFIISSPVEITDKFPASAGYVVDMTAGVATSYAITSQGRSFVWGDSTNYVDGMNNQRYAPRLVPEDGTDWFGDDAYLTDMGNRTGIQTYRRGDIKTWGRNLSGELGRSKPGEKNNVSKYKMAYFIGSNIDLDPEDKVVAVSAGNGVMALLTKYNRVFIWGDGQNGMLSIGGEAPNPNDPDSGTKLSSTPIEITDKFNLAVDDAITKISVGNSHVLALSQYGRVYSWGRGDFGQLGNGDKLGRDVATEITDQFNLPNGVVIEKIVAAGSGDSNLASYSYAVDSAGNVYAWGGSAKGLPGININTLLLKPSMISSRLSSKVSNVASVQFGGISADVFNVLNDQTMIVSTPNAPQAGPVDVVLTDQAGDVTTLTKAFSYLAPDTNNENNDHPSDNKSSDDPGSDQPNDDDNTHVKKPSSNNEKENADTDNDNDSDDEDDGRVGAIKSGRSGKSIAPPNSGFRLTSNICRPIFI